MNKLKTLKDIEKKTVNFQGQIITGVPACKKEFSDGLRQVAREWVKYLNEEATKNMTEYPQGKFQADWIKHFFNLEETK